MKRKFAGSLWQVKPLPEKSQGGLWNTNTCEVVPEPIEPTRQDRARWRRDWLESGDRVLVTGEPVPTIDADPGKRHHRYVPVVGHGTNGLMRRGYMNETYFVYGSIWLEKIV